jgi:hypothetical protein
MSFQKRNEMDVLPRIEQAGALNPDKTSKVSYTFSEGCLGSPISLQATTEQFCVYCSYFSDPEFHDPAFPKGGGFCGHWNGAVGFDDSCVHWEPNTQVKYWLSKGYMENTRSNYPRNPWYQVFDEPDGERGAR